MTPSTLHTPKCFQCGSPLIEVSKEVTHPEGSLFPQTVSKFRCSNQECQDQKDKEELKRLKLREDKLASDKLRDERKAADQQKRIEARRVIALGKKSESADRSQA